MPNNDTEKESTTAWSLEDELEREEFDGALSRLFAKLMHQAHRADGVEVIVWALIKSLIQTGKIDRADFDLAVLQTQNERTLARSGASEEPPRLRLKLAQTLEDKYQVPSPTDLDCQALLPICEARCCRLGVELSAQDLDEGRLSWNYNQPYQLLIGDTGYCVHHDSENRACTVYAERPAVCRRYDCRNDARIWTDFDKRLLAPLADDALDNR